MAKKQVFAEKKQVFVEKKHPFYLLLKQKDGKRKACLPP
jgi:hypothetical protein